MKNQELKELYAFTKASMTELFSSSNFKEKENYWLDDSHIHYPQINNLNDLERMLKSITTKLGRSALTNWGKNVREVLKYHNFVDMIKSYSISNKNCSIQNKGVVSKINYEGNETEIYPSQEIRTDSHLHITAEGCPSFIEEGLDPRKTVELIHDLGGIAIVEHPTTKCHPILQYIQTTEEDDKLTLEVMEMADAAEIFNSFNTLWMHRSNARAKKFVNEYNSCNPQNKIAGIAGSDNHYGLDGKFTNYLVFKNVGRTGIYLPKHDNKSLNDKEIIEQKRKDLKDGNFKTLENYTGPITFFMTMVPPIAARKLGINMDSIS